MKDEAGDLHREPDPPPSCSASHLAARDGPAVERARVRGHLSLPPPLSARARARGGKSLPNTELSAARGVMAAAAATLLDAVYDADGETDSARARPPTHVS